MEQITNEALERFNTCVARYGPYHRRMDVLDLTDKGEMWKALGAKFPPYQVLPDTNNISYIKSNLLASLYTVAKSAEIQPTGPDDKQLITQFNIALDRIWDTAKVGYYQFLAGERAALTNMGVTEVGWSAQAKHSSGATGNIVLDNVNPKEFMYDPFARGLDEAAYCFRYTAYHRTWFLSNPAYKDKFLEYEAAKKLELEMGNAPKHNEISRKCPDKDYYLLVRYYRKDEQGNVQLYDMINCECILDQKPQLKPNKFPYAILYCNPPADDLVGISECQKALPNNIAYNLMQSMALTSEYRNQRPPKFIDASSGINVNGFAQYGDQADRTFVVQGDASKAVHYAEFPQTSPALQGLLMNLQMGIENMTGVDQKYTGRNTGSITTTGGTQEMLNRVTVIDTPKILMYENYTRDLTDLILRNFIAFGKSRSYFFKPPNKTEWMTVNVDFEKMKHANQILDYAINISSELPKTKQRNAEMANHILEMQRQYNQNGESVDLITPEEWLFLQDMPNKEYMLERMGLQRGTDYVEQVTQILFQYTELVQQGATPEDAIVATANSMMQQGMAGPTQPDMPPGIIPQGVGVPEAAPLPMM